MPSYKELFPDKWLTPGHLGGGRARATVRAVEIEGVYNPRAGRPEPRLIVSFVGKQSRLICSKGQAERLAELAGTDDYDKWAGLQVILSAGRSPNGGETIVIAGDPAAAQGEAAERKKG